MTCSELTICTLCVQVNLDGYALPIKKLKGTEPVESLDLSFKNLGVASAIVIASLISINGSLTELSIYGNHVGGEGVRAICEAIQSNKETKLTSLNFGDNEIGPVGANAVAAMVAVTGSLTKLLLAENELEEEGTKAICEALEQNTTLKELDISGGWRASNIGGPAGVKHVAKMLGVNGAADQNVVRFATNKLERIWALLPAPMRE